MRQHRPETRVGPVNKTGRAPSRERKPGQAFMEFALGLPLMLLIMLGTLDIGQVFIDYVQLRNGCREAASFGARNPEDTPGIVERVYGHSPMLSDGQTLAAVEIHGDLDPQSRARTSVVVNCARTFTPITTGFLNQFFGIEPFQLDAVATAEVLK
jgi:hypothetical protein